MKNSSYKSLYYISFALTIALFSYYTYITHLNDVIVANIPLQILGILSIITFIVSNIFIFKNRKQKIQTKDLFLPLLYIIFFLIAVICSQIYNKDAIIPYLHYIYNYTYLLVPYIFLNMYTISIFKK